MWARCVSSCVVRLVSLGAGCHALLCEISDLLRIAFVSV